ncbi:hypothetical protein [Aeropyrum camini]|uniref:Uncharacterized protein n=1 Tax=Aeropyrum camini SY1 = JCM 12091 TaxID=1198449 RepID=U3TDR9_9CREN|nr:hypothetical protein [Aeropyrum camini]BAN90586.1 hypothetical protein ACAM_1117 [Aeropyrum camini SY1 = JCM 12091]
MAGEVAVKDVRGHSTGDTYEATITLVYKGGEHVVKVSRLCCLPGKAEAGVEDGKVVIRLYTVGGEPLASCIIDVGHLEKGCLDCKCLMLPPGERGAGEP